MIRLVAALASILALTVPGSGGAAQNEAARLTYSVGVSDARNTYAGFLGGGLCLAGAAGGEGSRLTAPRAYDSSPAWSPDGRRLAFRRASGPSHSGIYVQDEHGLTRSVIEVSSVGSIFQSVGSPDWSPGGQRIVFSKSGVCVRGCYPWAALFSIRPDGSDLRQLTPGGFVNDYDPAWSPRGDAIVFTSYDYGPQGGGLDLYLIDPDGGNRRLLVHDGHSPSWSPDGTSVVFSRNHADLNYSDLVIIGADGRGQRALTSQPGEEENPAWSPDGGWIAFEKRAQCGTRCGGGLEGTDIAVIRPDGTDEHVLRGSSLAELNPAWRPPAPRRPGRQRPCVIRGTHRANTIRATSRGDLILAGRGRDTVYGGGGDDFIDPGPGQDRIFGGPGRDLLYTEDGRRDLLDGGRGADEAYLDNFDRARSIEMLYPPTR